MAGRKIWTYEELESMNQSDLRTILDEIPSDCESLESDIESVMADEINIEDVNRGDQVLDIQNMDIVFKNSDQLEWDSEDEIPLTVIRQVELTKQPVVWTKDIAHVTGLISDIVFQTNLYALQKNGGSNNFVPTTSAEMKAFFGVNMLMSLKKMPSYRDYWSSKEEMRDFFISSVMSRDRFSWLLSNSHKYLLANGTYACGTIRKGRKEFPELKLDKELKRGNFHNPSTTEFVSRRKKDGSAENIPCPLLVKQYNTHMGYVDRFDMLKSIYELDRKSHKWWHRIFFYFLDSSIVNAFILFKKRSDSRCVSLKEFRLSIARGLIGAAPATRGLKRGSSPSVQLQNKFKKSYNSSLRRGVKWYRKLGIELIAGSALVNAYLFHQEITNNKMSITKFREEVIHGLVRRQSPQRNVPQEESHVLTETEKKQICSGYYQKNITLHGRKVAKNRTFKTKTRCLNTSSESEPDPYSTDEDSDYVPSAEYYKNNSSDDEDDENNSPSARKRQRNPQNWKRNEVKQKRVKGQQ
ncbi:hypothetical protein NQ314_013614 [Rhamnusium bicolor]|uniref:PiggyBac transposable element-derived protein domain-containing protein n=1 Tax=Rhamnusium bicolor TaxID=1586634 RepID=A0AAV8X614_9CUCU|nr:hypothetical protein NQ314_013614 [Rhamnusium bicolor]